MARVKKTKQWSLPFEMLSMNGEYGVKTWYNINGYDTVNKHACYSTLRCFIESDIVVKNVRASISMKIVNDLETVKWFHYLNEAYNREIYIPRLKENIVEVNYMVLAEHHRRNYKQMLVFMGFVRYLWEGGMPMIVRGAVYLKDKHPDADFMHCISAAVTLLYTHEDDVEKGNNHTIHTIDVPTTVTFRSFLSNLKIGSSVNDAVKRYKHYYPKLKHLGIYRVTDEYVITNSKVNFDSGTPLEILTEFTKELEAFDKEKGKKIKARERQYEDEW